MNWRRFRVPWRSQGKRGIGVQSGQTAQECEWFIRKKVIYRAAEMVDGLHRFTQREAVEIWKKSALARSSWRQSSAGGGVFRRLTRFAWKMSGVAGVWGRLQWRCGVFSGNGRVCTGCGAVCNGVGVDCKGGGAVCKGSGDVFKRAAWVCTKGGGVCTRVGGVFQASCRGMQRGVTRLQCVAGALQGGWVALQRGG